MLYVFISPVISARIPAQWTLSGLSNELTIPAQPLNPPHPQILLCYNHQSSPICVYRLHRSLKQGFIDGSSCFRDVHISLSSSLFR